MVDIEGKQLTEAQAAFLREPNYAVVTTLRPDGSPHATVVWVDTDGESVVFNITPERVKMRDLERDARASVLTIARDDPYRWLSVSGTAELTQDGANEHIDQLSWKYRGREFKLAPGEQRVLVTVRAEHVTEYGLEED